MMHGQLWDDLQQPLHVCKLDKCTETIICTLMPGMPFKCSMGSIKSVFLLYIGQQNTDTGANQQIMLRIELYCRVWLTRQSLHIAMFNTYASTHSKRFIWIYLICCLSKHSYCNRTVKKCYCYRRRVIHCRSWC